MQTVRINARNSCSPLTKTVIDRSGRYRCLGVTDVVGVLPFIKMNEKKEKQLAHDIDTISDDIRKKYRALKHGILEEEKTLTKSYKPILGTLLYDMYYVEVDECFFKIKNHVYVKYHDYGLNVLLICKSSLLSVLCAFALELFAHARNGFFTTVARASTVEDVYKRQI